MHITVFMQRVLHGGRRFWTIQLNYIREELARTDTLKKAVAEAYSAHTDTHTVCKRNTVYERSIQIATDILLPQLLLLVPLLPQVDTLISYQCVTCQNTGIIL